MNMDEHKRIGAEIDAILESRRRPPMPPRYDPAGGGVMAVYRNGPIPTRDVAGEWDRQDEEGREPRRCRSYPHCPPEGCWLDTCAVDEPDLADES